MDLTRIEKNIELLCTSMPSMVACSVNRICGQMSTSVGGIYCSPFSIMADICSGDMSSMNGCQDFLALCGNGTMVAQCRTPTLSLPAGAQLRNQIISICSSMPMGGCEKCYNDTGKTYIPSCDAFLVYSNLCVEMPEMSQCALWNGYCASIPSWTICGGDISNPNSAVEMKMYWHTTINDYVLFKEWVPRTTWGYIGTLLVCCAFAFVYEAFKAYVAWLENQWKMEASNGKLNAEKVETPFIAETARLEVAPFDTKRDLIRSSLHMISYGMHYWVMLLAMTFNVGIFFAILVGHFAGYLAFGRFSRLVRAEQSCCT